MQKKVILFLLLGIFITRALKSQATNPPVMIEGGVENETVNDPAMQFVFEPAHCNAFDTTNIRIWDVNYGTLFTRLQFRAAFIGGLAKHTISIFTYHWGYGGYYSFNLKNGHYTDGNGWKQTVNDVTEGLTLSLDAGKSVFEQGESLSLKAYGEATTFAWKTEVQVSDGGAYQTVPYTISGGKCIVTSSSISLKLSGDYVGKELKFRTRWIKVKDNTEIGYSTTTSIMYLPKLNVSISNTIPPKCVGGNNGSAKISVSGFPTTDTTLTGLSIYYFYTIDFFSRKYVELGGIPGEAKDSVTYKGIKYYLAGNGTTTSARTLIKDVTTFDVTMDALPDGYYRVSFYLDTDDQNFYPGTREFALEEPDSIKIQPNFQPYCDSYLLPTGMNQGNKLTVTASGGTSPLSGAIEGNAFTFGSPITYGTGENTIVVTDKNSCQATYKFTPTRPSDISIEDSLTIPVSCPDNSLSGSKTGGFDISLSGGCGKYFYTFNAVQDSLPEGESTIALRNLTPGTYSLRIGDETNPDFQTLSFTIRDIPALSQHHRLNTINCSYDKASVTIDSIAGFKGETWISSSATDSVRFALPPTNVTGLLPGATYNFIIRDQNNCSLLFSETMPSAPIPISHSEVKTPSSCIAAENGTVQINISGGEPVSSVYNAKFDNATYTDVTSFSKRELRAGDYQLVLSYDNKCFDTSVVTINSLTDTLKLLDPIATDKYCDSRIDGKINATALPSLAYNSPDFDWYLSQSDGTPLDTIRTNTVNVEFTNRDSGNYLLKVVDTAGCFFTKPVSVGVNPNQFAFSAIPLTTNTICNGIASGTLSVSVQNAASATNNYSVVGPGAYTNSTTDNLTASFTELPAGNFTITVEDDSSCIISTTASVGTNANPISFNIIENRPKFCDEVQSGRLNVSTNHNLGYPVDSIWVASYKNIPGYLIADDKAVFTNLGTNNVSEEYFIVARDSIGCINDSSISVQNIKNNPIAHIIAIDSLSCAGKTNGALTINVLQGLYAGKYEFRMNNNRLITDDVAFYDKLTNGTDYTISIADTNGCTSDTSLQIPIIANTFRISDTSIIKASCIRAANGQIRLSARGGVPSNQEYTFVLNEQDTLTGRDVVFDKLPTATPLSYKAFDNQGCMEESAAIVQLLPIDDSLNISISQIIDASCPDASTGAVAASTINGAPFAGGFNFKLYSVDSARYVRDFLTLTDASITGLAKGSYRIEALDMDNCLASESFDINEPKPVTLKATPGYVARKGDATGWASALAAQGNGRYIFEWYKGNTVIVDSLITTETSTSTTAIANLSAGNYLVRVSDTAGCKFWDDEWLENIVFVPEPGEALKVSVASITAVSCNGLSDGEVLVNANGGWGNNYLFGLDKANLTSNNRMGGLSYGAYKIIVQDTAGVNDSINLTVTEPDVLEASIASVQDAACFGYDNGAVHLNITGGNHKYYTSSDNVNWEEGQQSTGLVAGTYTIYVRDTLNCATNLSATVNQPDGIEIIDTTITNTLCGKQEGSILVVPAGGNPGYNYTWTSLAGDTLTGNADIQDLFSGNYFLQITDNSGCKQDFNFYVSDLSDLTISNWDLIPVSCWGGADGSAHPVIDLGTPPYLITWHDGTHTDTIKELSSGSYIMSVVDDEECKVYETFTIPTPDSISLNILDMQLPLCNGLSNGSIEIEALGGTPTYDYEWSTGRKRPGINGLEAGEYTVTVTDDHLCVKDFNFKLVNSSRIITELPEAVTLCKGNEMPLNPGKFDFIEWSSKDGYLSQDSVLYVSTSDRYFVELMDFNGCLGYDTIDVFTSETEFNVQCLMASEISLGDTIVIFEASRTVPDSMEIIFPGEFRVIDSSAYLYNVIPADTGSFNITMIAYLHDCMDVVTKGIVVLPESVEDSYKSTFSHLIKTFQLYPNPSDGNFSVNVELNRNADIKLRLLSNNISGILDSRSFSASDRYQVDYQLNGAAPGIYVLFLEAGEETRNIKFIIL